VAITPQVQHRFKVRSINDAGIGPWSADSMYFTTFCNGVASAISEPQGCVPTQTPTFRWTSIPAAVSYWLVVADAADMSAPTTRWLIDANTTATSYATPSGVVFEPQRTYYAKVKSILDPTSTTAAAWSPTIAFTPLCPGNDSVVVAQSVPTSMAAGMPYRLSVTMQNTGSNIWTSTSDYRLGAWTGGPWGISRVDLPSSAARDQQVTFNFTVTAPSAAGNYVSQWRMMQGLDAPEWFGQVTAPIRVEVYGPPPTVANLAALGACQK
jgi:hypothetical protein